MEEKKVTHVRIYQSDIITMDKIKLKNENRKDFISRIIKENKREVDEIEYGFKRKIDLEDYHICVDKISNLIDMYGSEEIMNKLKNDLQIQIKK